MNEWETLLERWNSQRIRKALVNPDRPQQTYICHIVASYGYTFHRTVQEALKRDGIALHGWGFSTLLERNELWASGERSNCWLAVHRANERRIWLRKQIQNVQTESQPQWQGSHIPL